MDGQTANVALGMFHVERKSINIVRSTWNKMCLPAFSFSNQE